MQRSLLISSRICINTINTTKCSLSSLAVKYAATGSPLSVLKLETISSIPQVTNATDVQIKMLASPINPSDLNMAEGTYGIKATLPAIGGNEGVAVVTNVGAKVTSLKAGDWVIPANAAFGTWRQVAVTDEKSLLKIPNDIPVAYAATIAVNPSTAYRLLRDFEKLKPGDVIIQNGANSMVGLSVIQMAREMGVKTINIVRSDRPSLEQTLRMLSNYGGDINVPEEYVNSYGFNEMIKELPPIKLALNCVGGDMCVDMVRVVGNGATMVTYGGMSKEQVGVPSDLISKKLLKMQSFWVTEWAKNNSVAERTAMINDIANMVKSKKLSLLYEMHDFDDFNYALQKSMEPYGLRKTILNMDYPDRLKEHDARPSSDYWVFQTDTV